MAANPPQLWSHHDLHPSQGHDEWEHINGMDWHGCNGAGVWPSLANPSCSATVTWQTRELPEDGTAVHACSQNCGVKMACIKTLAARVPNHQNLGLLLSSRCWPGHGCCCCMW